MGRCSGCTVGDLLNGVAREHATAELGDCRRDARFLDGAVGKSVAAELGHGAVPLGVLGLKCGAVRKGVVADAGEAASECYLFKSGVPIEEIVADGCDRIINNNLCYFRTVCCGPTRERACSERIVSRTTSCEVDEVIISRGVVEISIYVIANFEFVDKDTVVLKCCIIYDICESTVSCTCQTVIAWGESI